MRTKLIATIGPASEDEATLRALVEAGVDVARVNFSHCTEGEFRLRRERLDQIAAERGSSIAVMQDLQGPRLRVGALPEAGVHLAEGEVWSFAHGCGFNQADRLIPVSHAELQADVAPGEPIFLTNGLIELTIERVTDDRVSARVIRGGLLFPGKAINLPRTTLSLSGLTEKDRRDLKLGLAIGIDYVALSFVQSADDIIAARKIIGDYSNIRLVAKIERAVALERIDEIVRVADGIMVARGDLGVEIPIEEIPIVQKYLIRQAHWHGKFAIVATQLLSSMVDHPQPTRAEVSDVANAVFDGADAIMLSDETANGAHPVAAAVVARRVVDRIEMYLHAERVPSDAAVTLA